MDIDIQKQPTNHLKDRILRFKPVCFIKNNWLVLAVLSILGLTFLFHVWNIRSYNLTDSDGLVIPSNVSAPIDKYMQDNLIGKDYFSFSTNTYEKDMEKSLSYVKSVTIEKVVPNKLEVFVSIYQPATAAYIKGESCYLLSEEGYELDQICSNDTQNCCTKYASDHNIYLFSSSDVDISSETGKKQLLIMSDISKISKTIEVYKYEISKISLNDSVIEVDLNSGQSFSFSMSEDIDTQLERFIAVANKIKSDNLEFKSIDFRFERPVLKN
jgi:cell division septal protein FtsQ